MVVPISIVFGFLEFSTHLTVRTFLRSVPGLVISALLKKFEVSQIRRVAEIFYMGVVNTTQVDMSTTHLQ